MISRFRFRVQGLRELAQVALIYLYVSKTFCFPGITSDTVSPGPIPKYPGRAPKGESPVASRVLHGGCYCASQASRCCLGGFLSAAFFIWAHSQREMWARPRPTGSLTARVLEHGGSAPPRVSTFLLLFTRPPSVVTWDCASSFAPARLSRAPRSG